MSDTMLLGVLRMPLPDDPAELSAIELAQIRCRMREAADRIEQGAARVEMLDWLAANVTEAPMDPKRFEHMEFPDTRLRWVLPTMPSWAEYCGQISFKEAVKIAMEAQKQ